MRLLIFFQQKKTDLKKGDCRRLSDGIKSLNSIVRKLDTSRSQLQSQLSDAFHKIADNSRIIQNLNDSETRCKNAMKVQISDLENKLDQQKDASIKQSVDTLVKPAVKGFDSRLCQLEKRSQNNTFNTHDMKSLDASFKMLSDNMCSKLDSLNASVRQYFERSVPRQNELNRDIFRRIREQQNRYPHRENPESDSDIIDLTGSHDSHVPSLSAAPPSVEINVVPRNEFVDKRLQDKQNNQKFRGVIRRNAKSYFLTGIELDIGQESLEQFLEDNNISFKTVKFLNTRRTDCQSAQIVVSADQSELVENPNTWPPGIICRPWMTRTDYRKRYAQL